MPTESAQEFKNYAESMTEGGRKELYTKSISPFLQDREENPPQPTLPLEVCVRVCMCACACVYVACLRVCMHARRLMSTHDYLFITAS